MAANWKKIKTEYITTDTSYRKLADKYGVHYKAVSQKGKAEGWVELRAEYRAKTITKTIEKTSDLEANRLAQLMETTAKAIDVAVRAFDDKQQFNRYIVETGPKNERETVERVFDKVDTRALKDLTAVLKDLTGLMRDFYNIPTPAQAEAQRIAAERLELDRRKSAFAHDDDDDGTGVVLLPPRIGEEANDD